MQNITVGRYDLTDPTPAHETAGGYSGWVEGATTGGQRWIFYLDCDGRPVLYWGRREADGAVVGDPIALT